ncbi:MAG: hypothetical protein ABSH11_05195 [Verrucomicrobiota bacterium]|jgi:hypothetical protein
MQPKDARDVLKVDPMDQSHYEKFQFSLAHLTAYSIHWLTVWEIPTTYENISVLNGRLFPPEFGLPGFPEFPDSTRTLRSILQMRPKYRGFATSDPRKGVFLTEKGREVAAKVLEAIGMPTFDGKRIKQNVIHDDRGMPKDKQHTRNPTQIIADCKTKLLYKRFSEGRFEETEIVHFLGLVSLYDHTPPSEVQKAFRQLRKDALATGDKEFLTFLDRVEERFSAYLNRADAK